jgi:hypothetical protein
MTNPVNGRRLRCVNSEERGSTPSERGRGKVALTPRRGGGWLFRGGLRVSLFRAVRGGMMPHINAG